MGAITRILEHSTDDCHLSVSVSNYPREKKLILAHGFRGCPPRPLGPAVLGLPEAKHQGVGCKAAPHGVHEGARDGREVEREERRDEGKRGKG